MCFLMSLATTRKRITNSPKRAMLKIAIGFIMFIFNFPFASAAFAASASGVVITPHSMAAARPWHSEGSRLCHLDVTVGRGQPKGE